MIKKMTTTERRAFIEEFAVSTVALAMAEAMHNSGLSQRDVAKKLGVSEARISQMFSATGNPTIKSLARLADVLGRELRIEFSQESHIPENSVEWRVADDDLPPTQSASDFRNMHQECDSEDNTEVRYVSVAA